MTARVIARLRPVFVPAAGPATASAIAAITVAPQVRKSLAEIVEPGGLLEVGVDVVRAHVGPAAAALERQQLVAAAAALLEALDRVGDLGVDDGLHAALAALGRVVEQQRVALHRGVALAHRRQPVGLVRDGVVLGADPEEAAVQQPHGAGQHVVAVELVAGEVRGDALAQRGQRAGELDHVVELLLVAALAPARVVQVLLAPAVVDAGGLDVAARVRADPDVLPGRRDHQLVDPLQHLGVGDALAVGVEVLEPLAAPPARRCPGPCSRIVRSR